MPYRQNSPNGMKFSSRLVDDGRKIVLELSCSSGEESLSYYVNLIKDRFESIPADYEMPLLGQEQKFRGKVTRTMVTLGVSDPGSVDAIRRYFPDFRQSP